MGFRGGGSTITNFGPAPPAVDAASAGGAAATASRSDHTHAHTAALHQAGGEADLTALFLAVAQRAAANGVASLDAATRLPAAQLPTTAEVTGNKGAANGYAGLDAGSLVPAANSRVQSVNGGTGAVAITAAGLGAETTANKGAANGYAGLDAGSLVPAVNSRVASVAGRTGAVTLAVADVTNAESTANKGAANGYAGLGAGALVPAAQLGTGTADATHFLAGDGTFKTVTASAAAFSGVRVRNGGNTSIAGSTFTLLPFDTNVIISTAGYHSTSTNTSRLVAQTTGKHKVYVADVYQEGATADGVQRKLSIYVNGTNVTEFFGTVGGNSKYSGTSGAITLDLTAGDYVEVKKYQDSSTTGTVQGHTAGVNNHPIFGMEYIGA